MASMLQKKHKCTYAGCTHRFQNNEDLEGHIRSKHSQETLRCQTSGCNFTAPSAAALRRHNREEHEKKMYSCPFCRNFKSKRSDNLRKRHLPKCPELWRWPDIDLKTVKLHVSSHDNSLPTPPPPPPAAAAPVVAGSDNTLATDSGYLTTIDISPTMSWNSSQEFNFNEAPQHWGKWTSHEAQFGQQASLAYDFTFTAGMQPDFANLAATESRFTIQSMAGDNDMLSPSNVDVSMSGSWADEPSSALPELQGDDLEWMNVFTEAGIIDFTSA